MSTLSGKRAVVTGAASGLGLSTARALAGAGVDVVCADVAEDEGRRAASEVGGQFVRCDVASLEDNLVLFEQAGAVDLVFLNAGIATQCGLGADFSPARYRRAMSVNLDGVVFGTHAAVPALEANGGGAIVVTASRAGLGPDHYDPIYGAGKHAVVGLTRSLGPALAPRGIRYNAVCPGLADTKIIDNAREEIAARGFPVMAPERVADTVLFLFETELTGECWYVVNQRPSARFDFPSVPAPVVDGEVGPGGSSPSA